MAEDMVERAARAIWETFNQGPEWGKRREPMKDETRKEARAALLAALDPEDEALVERVGMEIADHTTGEYSRGLAQRIIATLKAVAQGETR